MSTIGRGQAAAAPGLSAAEAPPCRFQEKKTAAAAPAADAAAARDAGTALAACSPAPSVGGSPARATRDRGKPASACTRLLPGIALAGAPPGFRATVPQYRSVAEERGSLRVVGIPIPLACVAKITTPHRETKSIFISRIYPASTSYTRFWQGQSDIRKPSI